MGLRFPDHGSIREAVRARAAAAGPVARKRRKKAG